MKKNIFSGILLLSLLTIASCSDDYSEITMKEAQMANDAQTNTESVYLAKGMTFDLTYKAIPDSTEYPELEAYSTDDGVASIASDGKITAVGTGNAYINIKQVKAFKTIKSIPVKVASVASQLEAGDFEMYATTSRDLTDTTIVNTFTNVIPGDGYKIFDYTSSDESVAKIEDGKLKALKEGTIKLTMKTKDGSNLQAVSKVTVVPAIPATDLVIPSGQEFGLNETSPLNVTLTPENATLALISWKSSNENVAAIDEEGNITTKAFGTTDITATTSTGKNITATISVVKGKINDEGIKDLSKYISKLTDNATGSIRNNNLVIKWAADAKTLTNIIRDEETWINADTYPILAIKTNGQDLGQWAPNPIWHNFDFYTSVANQKFNMVWGNTLKTPDGNHVYFINLQTAFGGIYKGKGDVKATKFYMQTGYDHHSGEKQTQLTVFWMKTFKSMEELNKYIENEK